MLIRWGSLFPWHNHNCQSPVSLSLTTTFKPSPFSPSFFASSPASSTPLALYPPPCVCSDRLECLHHTCVAIAVHHLCQLPVLAAFHLRSSLRTAWLRSGTPHLSSTSSNLTASAQRLQSHHLSNLVSYLWVALCLFGSLPWLSVPVPHLAGPLSFSIRVAVDMSCSESACCVSSRSWPHHSSISR